MSATESALALSDIIKNMVLEAVKEATPRNKRLASTKEAARYLGVSVRTVQVMVANGELQSVSAGRRVLIDYIDMDNWIDGQKAKRP